jgi:hypothetical protein
LEGLASGSSDGKSGSSRTRLALGTGGDGSELMSVTSVEADERGGRSEGSEGSVLGTPRFESGELLDIFATLGREGRRRRIKSNKSLLVTLGLMFFPLCQVVINFLTELDIPVTGGTMHAVNTE